MKHWRCKICGKVVLFKFFHMGASHDNIKIRWSWQRHGEGISPEETNSYFERVERIIGDTWTVIYDRKN